MTLQPTLIMLHHVAVVNGCTDATAFNHNPNANTDDNSCIAIALGCMNPQAFNYDPSANTDNASCVAVVNAVLMQQHSTTILMQTLMIIHVLL